MQDIVDDYKNANLTISKNCKKISEMLLVKIDGKRVYDNLEFEDEQVTKLIFPLNNNVLFFFISMFSEYWRFIIPLKVNQCLIFNLQKNHGSNVQTRLQVIHMEVVSIMKQTYEVFKHDGQEVDGSNNYIFYFVCKVILFLLLKIN